MQVRQLFRQLRTAHFQQDPAGWFSLYRYVSGQTYLAEVSGEDGPVCRPSVVLYDVSILEEAPQWMLRQQARERLQTLRRRQDRNSVLRNRPLMEVLGTLKSWGLAD